MIIQNGVTCLSCGDFIVSKHRHDFVECTGGANAVDGGQDYLRRIGDFTNATDHSWSIDSDLYFDCAQAVSDALDTGRNNIGVANAVLRKLREAGRIVAEHEQRIFAENKNLDEIMVEETDGTINRYKKVIDNV